MSSPARIPVCVTLPPDLIERADRIAEADDRSRSFVVVRALKAFCDSVEIPPGAHPDAATDAARPDVSPARPGGASPSHQEQPMQPAETTRAVSVQENHMRGLDALQRHVTREHEKAAEQTQARDAALERTAAYISNLGRSDNK